MGLRLSVSRRLLSINGLRGNVASLTYIDLFAGVSMLGQGFEAGCRYLGIAPVCLCHVEGEIYAAGVLAARMQEVSLAEAPIWSDVRTFNPRLSGYVDAIVGGFPCQDLSVAGKRAGIEGQKSGLWSEFIRIIRDVRPKIVFLENVPGILDNPALGRVLGDLAAAGFDAEWGCFSAAEVGAPHKRERWFCVAYRAGGRLRIVREPSGSARLADGDGCQLEHADEVRTWRR